LEHAKGAANQLYPPVSPQTLNKRLLWQAGDQQVDIFACTAEQGISYRSPNRVNAPACFSQVANDGLGD
jgi:hypothetical protein